MFSELIQTVPDAFNRYLLFLFVALIFGAVIIWKDDEIKEMQKNSVIAIALILGISLSWIALSRVLQFPICGDDSYIDFRYVRNWVNGVSFDYNPGQRVVGFTSHIHLLLLYLCKLFLPSISIDVISQMMNVLFQFLNLSILYFFLKDLFNKHSAVLAGVFAYAFDPTGIEQTIFGKESHILICFLIFSIWAMHRKRYHAVAWLSSLMPFIRPEAVLWWGIALIWSIKEKGRETIKFYLSPLTLVLAIVGTMYFYFGTVVPHGMLAKFKMYYPNDIGLMFARVMELLGTSIFIPRYFIVEHADLPFLPIIFLSSIICGLVTLFASFKIFRNSIVKWYIFAIVGYALVFGIKNPVSFSWYHCWFFLLPVFFLAVMVPALIKLITDSSQTTLKRVLACSAFAYLILVQLVQQIAIPVPNLANFAFRFEPEFQRIAQFGRAYKKIQSYPGYEQSTIGAPEIGYLGFIHKGKILDFCGLLSPEVVKIGRLPLTKQAKKTREIFEINPAAVEKFRPDYIITLEAFGREMRKDSFFQENYKEIAWLKNDWFKTKGIYVYKLRPINQKEKSQPKL